MVIISKTSDNQSVMQKIHFKTTNLATGKIDQ